MDKLFAEHHDLGDRHLGLALFAVIYSPLALMLPAAFLIAAA